MTVQIGSGGRPRREARFSVCAGSFAMSGRDYLRYGGNTTSIELVARARASAAFRSILGTGGATELSRRTSDDPGTSAKVLAIASDLLVDHAHAPRSHRGPVISHRRSSSVGNEYRDDRADPNSGLSLDRRCRRPGWRPTTARSTGSRTSRRRHDQRASCPAPTSRSRRQVTTAAFPDMTCGRPLSHRGGRKGRHVAHRRRVLRRPTSRFRGDSARQGRRLLIHDG